MEETENKLGKITMAVPEWARRPRELQSVMLEATGSRWSESHDEEGRSWWTCQGDGVKGKEPVPQRTISQGPEILATAIGKRSAFNSW